MISPEPWRRCWTRWALTRPTRWTRWSHWMPAARRSAERLTSTRTVMNYRLSPEEPVQPMLDLLRSAAAFIVVLGVLVFVHEFGHYIAARWRGVHVEVFSIGFGPAIATWRDRRRHGMEARLAAARRLREAARSGAAGGRVRTRSAQTGFPGRTFHEKRVGSRAIVVAAGPIANFLLAIVLFAALFATAGKPTILPVAGGVLPDSAAARAGLAGRTTASSRSMASRSSTSTTSSASSSTHPSEKLTLTVRRGGSTLDVAGDDRRRAMSGGTRVGMLGISGGQIEYRPLSLPAALLGGVTQTWQVTADTIVRRLADDHWPARYRRSRWPAAHRPAFRRRWPSWASPAWSRSSPCCR